MQQGIGYLHMFCFLFYLSQHNYQTLVNIEIIININGIWSLKFIRLIILMLKYDYGERHHLFSDLKKIPICKL